jgi:SNF2 family DNA or RNA helicase
MISAESRGDKLLVRFKGKKQQFNEYINKIMSLPDKEWNIQERCWSIPKSSLSALNSMFKNIEFLEEIKPKTNKTLDIKDYENMGKSMKLQPYDYQKEAIKFALDTHETLIVYPCGSGKTPIGIGLYIEAVERNIIEGPGMIVVKASLKTQWLKEIEKFSHLKPVIIRTKPEITENIKDKIKRRQTKIDKLDKIADKNQIRAFKNEIEDLKTEMDEVFIRQFDNSDLYVLNYETLRDVTIRSELHRRKIQFVFADEVHYVKNRDSKRSEALYEFGAAKMKIGATATPVGKNPEDIFGIFKFVCPTLFPSFSNFARLYIKYAGFGKVAGVKNKEHLLEKYAPHTIVKTKEEISSQLPDLVVIQRYCEMTSDQIDANQRIMIDLDELKNQEKAIRVHCKSETEARNNTELMKVEAMILALQTFAQEVADAPQMLLNSQSEMSKSYAISDNSSPKLDLMAELVEEVINSEEKVCIFSKYERMQPILTKRILEIDKSIKIAYVNGSIKDKTRYSEVYDKFRDNPEYKVLLMTDAGAEGLNLSKCKYVIEYDLADSYGIQTQRHGRVERSDSVHDTVFVYQLIANESWDEIQAKIIEKKESYDAELIKSLAKE